MNNEYLWQFEWDMRGGSVSSLFVATEAEVKDAIGSYAYFGEVLGKHSEVYGTIDEGDIWKLDVSCEAVAEVSRHLGDTWSGYNPLHYIEHQCSGVLEDGEQCEESYTIDDLYVIDEKYYCYDCKKALESEGNDK